MTRRDVDTEALASIREAALRARHRATALSTLEGWFEADFPGCNVRSVTDHAALVRRYHDNLVQMGMRKVNLIERDAFLQVARDLHKNTLLG